MTTRSFAFTAETRKRGGKRGEDNEGQKLFEITERAECDLYIRFFASPRFPPRLSVSAVRSALPARWADREVYPTGDLLAQDARGRVIRFHRGDAEENAEKTTTTKLFAITERVEPVHVHDISAPSAISTSGFLLLRVFLRASASPRLGRRPRRASAPAVRSALPPLSVSAIRSAPAARASGAMRRPGGLPYRCRIEFRVERPAGRCRAAGGTEFCVCCVPDWPCGAASGIRTKKKPSVEPPA